MPRGGRAQASSGHNQPGETVRAGTVQATESGARAGNAARVRKRQVEANPVGASVRSGETKGGKTVFGVMSGRQHRQVSTVGAAIWIALKVDL